MTRVALLGCGWIQMPHVHGVLTQGELVPVLNDREGSAGVFAERHGILRVTLDREHSTRDRTVDVSARQAST